MSDTEDRLSELSLQGREAEELSDGHFQMPYTIVRDGIEKTLKAKFALLKKNIRQMEKQKRESFDKFFIRLP